ncbi:hypothetical protein JK364_50580 [Streptomyces sp. 110]|uniref:5-hmdU DNA kinase helical domain-containing protein n=1 Tax=Streptomyces endocoffeicus TaxID=2898945 RepID=A0ABS1Q735_9ACTN|nr:nucleotide kinase domain-containing protein [Streptomyces endocoffeicus]MBL1120486.1 hypothetical protein [Streptomyces endocoffeicus]
MVRLLQDRQASTVLESVPSAVQVAGRVLQPTPVFDTYWRFASARQAVYEARLAGRSRPWTDDPILAGHRFTNCYRAADRVSQAVIGEVIYQGHQGWEDVFFRTLLFKIFNKESTWRLLTREMGEVRWETYDYRSYDRVLSAAFARGERLYSAAYIVPPPQLGEDRKHRNHLRLLEMMMTSGAAERVGQAATMRQAYEVLLGYPAIGPFLAYQFTIDLNYAPQLAFSEMDFVVPGPGARDGIRKCFGSAADGIEADLIRYMADSQRDHFDRLQLSFAGLKGRPLQLIDCQNLFCEVDKYARVAHPEIAGISGRTRIKQAYRLDAAPLRAWFPPKWGLNA